MPWRLRRFRILAFVSVFAASAGALYALLAGLFVTAAVDIPVIVTLIAVRQWGALRHWLLARALALLAWAPLAVALYGGVAARAGNYWVKPASFEHWLGFLGHVLFMWKNSFATASGEGALRVVLVLSLSGVAVVGIAALIRTRQWMVLALFAGAAAIPILLIAAISLHTPIVIERYATFATIGFAAIAATGVAYAWRGPVWSKFAVAFVLTALGINLAQFMVLDRRRDLRPAAEIIRLRDGPQARLYARWRPAMGVTLYFLGQPRPSRFPEIDDLIPELRSAKAAWLFDLRNGRDLERIRTQAKAAGLEAEMLRVETFHLDGYQLHRIETR